MVKIIDWKKIKENQKVKLKGPMGLRSYYVGDKIVVWKSTEALKAHKFLQCKRKGKKRCLR